MEMFIKAIPKIEKLIAYFETRDFTYIKSLLSNYRQLSLVNFNSLDDFAENGFQVMNY